MPAPRPPTSTRKASRQLAQSRRERSQIAFILLSSLVVCSLLVTALVAVTATGLFGLGGSASPTIAPNYQDPNLGVIGQQQTAVARNPNDVESVLLLANMLSNSGKLQAAIPYYQKAIDLKPDDAAARLDFARALSDGDLNGDAELQFKKVIALDPDNQDAHYYLAELYSRWQPPRTSEAIAEYQRAFEIDPTTLIGQQSRNALAALGVATPAASPAATPGGQATPEVKQ